MLKIEQGIRMLEMRQGEMLVKHDLKLLQSFRKILGQKVENVR